MARQHELRETVRIRTGEDVWPAFERAERAALDQTQGWEGRNEYLRLKDSGGQEDFPTVAEAKAALAGSRHKLVGIGVWMHDKDRTRAVSISVDNLDAGPQTPKWIAVSAEGPDEASVVGLAKVVIDEVKAARREAASLRGTALIAAKDHPWVVGIGSSITAAAILGIGSRVLG